MTVIDDGEGDRDATENLRSIVFGGVRNANTTQSRIENGSGSVVMNDGGETRCGRGNKREEKNEKENESSHDEKKRDDESVGKFNAIVSRGSSL